MNINELLPFSRNRYYKGKMLTSADFEAEQTYMNNKRSFLNMMMSGSGIVCGLNVVSLDDLSIMIESGVAIDDMGREIVVENSVVKKLSTIAGFEQLNTNKACLCVKYADVETQPVYAINRQDKDKEYENNRIEETYELFLMDQEAIEAPFEFETEFFTGGTLLDTGDYQVSVKIPSQICAGHYVKLVVEVKKLSDVKSNLYYEGVLQTPAFTTLDKTQELNINLENISLEQGQSTTREYWILAGEEELLDSSIMLKSGSAKALVNGVEVPVITKLNFKINIILDTPIKLAAREIGKTSMEFRSMGGYLGMIRLANISLVRTDSAYLIESIEENNVKSYIPTLRDEWQRHEFESCFQKKMPFYASEGGEVKNVRNESSLSSHINNGPKIETGVVEIPIGENARRGDIVYSGEIMHGLGKGNVYVEVGYETIEEDATLGCNAKTTVFGDPSLFEKDSSKVAAQTAVKVLNDKGSFVVALKLLQDVKLLVLSYRWVAIRYSGEQLEEDAEVAINQSISAITPTIVVGTKESYFFQVKFNHMKQCSISYELTEPGSGEITPDGIYTAPAKEGVYEIRIYCTDKPLICTYAYAIVKKKNVTEETESEV